MIEYLHAFEVQVCWIPKGSPRCATQVYPLLLAPAEHINGNEQVVRVNIHSWYIELVNYFTHDGIDRRPVTYIHVEVGNITCNQTSYQQTS